MLGKETLSAKTLIYSVASFVFISSRIFKRLSKFCFKFNYNFNQIAAYTCTRSCLTNDSYYLI